MIKINGIEMRAIRTEKSTDNVSLQFCSLYLEQQKIASVQMEKKGTEGTVFVQLFMMYGYSEEALRAQLEAQGLTPEALMSRFEWLRDMKKQYDSHKDTAPGIACLQHESSNVILGIPGRLEDADEETLLGELQGVIERNEHTYGPCMGYAIFRSEKDFSVGEPIALESLKK